MGNHEIKARLNSIGKAWEEFKTVNDRKDKEAEKKGAADLLFEEQLGRISGSLDEHKERICKLEAAARRPALCDSKNYANEDIQMAHKEALCNYLKKGVEDNLYNLQCKTLSVASDPDGGYLVSPQLSTQITKSVLDTSPMRKLASIELISSDILEIIEDRDEAEAGWTTETAPVNDTDTPQINKRTIAVHELYAQPKATQKLIDDSMIDIESWLAGKVADIFVRKENNAFVAGDGEGKPRGILTYPSGANWGQIEQMDSGAEIVADNLFIFYYRLKEAYASRASFLMNRATVDKIRRLKDSSGQYLWSPGLAVAAPDTLIGVPVYQAADMPLPETGALAIALADFKTAYKIVDRMGIRVLRDPFTEKPFVKFYTTKRVGGDIINFDAIKIMRIQ